VAAWRAAGPQIEGLSEGAIREALERLDPLWEELFPAEQTRIIQLLVQRIDLKVDGLELHLRTQGLGHVAADGCLMPRPEPAVVTIKVPFAVRKRGKRCFGATLR